MMLFFTSDHHFGHKNIIEYCNRPFSSLREMNQIMIDRWNSVVKPTDTIYHLGDFSLSGNMVEVQGYMDRLNGQICILGNRSHHDRFWLKIWDLGESFGKKNKRIEIIESQVILEIDPQDLGLPKAVHNIPIHLNHWEQRTWDREHYGAWHLFGHDHRPTNLYGFQEFSMNVGVDANDFTPVSLNQVHDYMKACGWYYGWKRFG